MPLFVLMLFIFSCLLYHLVEPVSEYPRYTRSWAVEIDGGEREAERLAKTYGLINRGEVVNKHYHFDLVDGGRTSVSETITQSLTAEITVRSALQQVVKKHVKRDYTVPPDPEWPQQWYLTNTSDDGKVKRLNARVEQVWLQGFTGLGVTTAVVDDGLEWEHIDLTDNYDASVSYNFAANRSDPTPPIPEENHGTQCAGVIAMSKNRHCGIGAAFQCKIGGIRLNIEESLDVQEAKALGYQPHAIDIYSNSWGPTDDGVVVEGPGPLVSMVLEKNTKTGREGRGSIYVWAAGNGGKYHDSCAADGYVNSIYTIAVGSADQDGHPADYDEPCSAKMAVTFSHNSESTGPQLAATLLGGQCTVGFTGTSASAPLLTAIIALALQANPDLTWRDVQYLIVYTSNPDILTVDDLTTNGAGLKFSHSFGFGAIDAEAMVTRARHWTNVPEQQSFTSPANQSEYIIRDGLSSEIDFTVNSDHCNNISYLEHVVVSASLSIILTPNDTLYNFTDYVAAKEEGRDMREMLESGHPRRGDVKIELSSPSGTLSTLLPNRDYDFINSEGYDNWSFMSVHFWGESPVGSWTLRTSFRSSSASVLLENVTLTLYGVSEVPESDRYRSVCDGCLRGRCAHGICDVCPQLRSNATLECVTTCPNFTTEYAGYCIEGRVIYPSPTVDNTSRTTVIAMVTVVCFIVITLSGISAVILAVFVIRHRKLKRNLNVDPNIYCSLPINDDETTEI